MVLALLLAVAAGAAPPGPARADTTSEMTLEMLQEVKRLRGLESRGAVGVGRKSPAALSDLLDERIAEEYSREELAGLERLLLLTGLIPPDYDLINRYVELLASQALGFYDFHTETFFLSTSAEAGLQAPVVLHELTHALQDQHFGIHDRLRALRGDEDARSALQAFIEGEATALMLELSLEHVGRRFYTLPTEELLGMLGDQRELFRNEPPVMRDFLYFPYEAGLPFMRAVRRRMPWPEVDELYRSPPASTEQMMHPERYLVRPDPPRRLRWPETPGLPPGRWRRLDSNTLGEFGAYVLLKPFVGDELEAREAAAGWGGDRYMVLEEAPGGRAAVLLSWVWDTERDAGEFARAYRRAVSERPAGGPVEPEAEGRGWVARLSQGLTLVERRADRVLVLEGVPAGLLEEFRALGWSAEVAPASGEPPPTEDLAKAEHYRRRAETLRGRGKPKEAARAARRAVELGPDDAEALYLLGAALAEEEATLAEGVQHLSRAVGLEPSLGPALLELGRTLGRLELVEESRGYLERARSVMPDHPEAARALAEALLEAGEAEAAWQALEPLYSSPRRDAADLVLLGRVAQGRGRFKEARGHLAASLAVAPTLEGRLAMGELELEEGHLGAAEEQLLGAEELDADGTSALLALGGLYLKQGRLAEARARYREAALRDPRDPSAATSLGRMALEAGDLRAAEAWFAHALAADPRWRPALRGLEGALARQGRPSGRLRELLGRPAALDSSVRKALRAGRRCLEVGLLRRARQQLGTAVRLDPDHAEAWARLGEVHEREERRGLAKVAYLKALSSPDPLPPDLQERLFRWVAGRRLREASPFVLRRFLEARDEGERQRAALALGALGDRSAAPALLESLEESPSPAVQAAIAEALGRLGDPLAVGPLERLADSSGDPQVRSAARRALERLQDDKPF